jgi:hypothetical protein
MDDIEVQTALNNFETRMLDGCETASVREALRAVLFAFAGSPIKGSVGDGLRILADQPRPPTEAASVMLRAIAADDLLQANNANQLERNVVVLVEKCLPRLSAFLKLESKSQTYEKFEILFGVKAWVDGQLEPLRVPYTTLDSMIAARKAIVHSLSHGLLNEIGGA